MKVEKAKESGVCYGVRLTIEKLEKIARERGNIEALGAIVHNKQVEQRMADLGITVAETLDAIRGKRAAIGAHGVGPEVEADMRSRFSDVIDTTCPFVQRAQRAAARMVRDGFFVLVYGDGKHPEVKGILEWAGGNGIATIDEQTIKEMQPLPRRIGLLSQTTQIPARFTEFAKKVIDAALVKDAEVKIVDTICHDTRQRQSGAQELARRSDIILIVGSSKSANTGHLVELCSMITETRLIERAEEVDLNGLDGKRVGVAGGASTAEETINEVMDTLQR